MVLSLVDSPRTLFAVSRTRFAWYEDVAERLWFGSYADEPSDGEPHDPWRTPDLSQLKRALDEGTGSVLTRLSCIKHFQASNRKCLLDARELHEFWASDLFEHMKPHSIISHLTGQCIPPSALGKMLSPALIILETPIAPRCLPKLLLELRQRCPKLRRFAVTPSHRTSPIQTLSEPLYDYLRAMPTLEHVELCGRADLIDESVFKLLMFSPSLKLLVLDHEFDLSSLAAMLKQAFSLQLPVFPKLQSLEASLYPNHPWSDVFQRVKNLRHISVHIEDTSTDFHRDVQGSLRLCPNLEEIRIQGRCLLPIVSLRHLATACPQVKKLNIEIGQSERVRFPSSLR